MEIKDIKDELRNIPLMTMEIDSLLEEQTRLHNVAESCGAIQYGERIQSTPNQHKMEDAICKLADLDGEIVDRLCQYFEVRNRAVQDIMQIEDIRMRQILYQEYIIGKNMLDISRELAYNYDYVKHLKSEALIALQKIKDSTK